MTSKFHESEWHWQALDGEGKEQARGMAAKADWLSLKLFYIEKKVAPRGLKCPFCNDLEEVRNWTLWAMATNKL